MFWGQLASLAIAVGPGACFSSPSASLPPSHRSSEWATVDCAAPIRPEFLAVHPFINSPPLLLVWRQGDRLLTLARATTSHDCQQSSNGVPSLTWQLVNLTWYLRPDEALEMDA